ncbi:DNA-binding PadR family transcriptional regulator [Crossiella equi]|uniref:DNA-binding PadR family transcriptional regulator n=1 Tax=Crossiella equi TaxID=130796 RepID=A0ABS5AAM7_9PSEU|nr:PadR family transcriptional regulator [Crossiella equi]MBP2473628.1 DNA-binding PadR family transcriptional regulator [Crossiella equi]
MTAFAANFSSPWFGKPRGDRAAWLSMSVHNESEDGGERRGRRGERGERGEHPHHHGGRGRGRGRGPHRHFWGGGPDQRPFVIPPFGGPGFGRPKVGRGDVRAAVLLVLVDGPTHGYQLIADIAERSDGNWKPSPGSIYPVLKQLAEEGLVVSEKEGGRQMVELTDAGRAYVAENEAELAQVWDTVSGGVNTAVVELQELLGQVHQAALQVAAAGTPEQNERARQLLTETRRSLYRILAEDEGR